MGPGFTDRNFGKCQASKAFVMFSWGQGGGGGGGPGFD